MVILELRACEKSAALDISGLRGARHPHVLEAHSGGCAPGAPDLPALATIFRTLWRQEA